MGIKGLNNFLRTKCPNCFVELPKSYFKGKRIAIDSNNVLYRYMSRAHKEIVNKTDVAVRDPDRDEIIKRWIYHVKNFVIEMLNMGATPIFVFDGEYIPQKSATQKKRREDRQKMVNEAEEYKAKIMAIDELERTSAMVSELRKKMQNLSSMPSDDRELIMGILEGAGLPVLIATGEGEKLCAMLCIEGRVDAVYSRDTDLVAFGCPLTINEPGGYITNAITGEVEECFKCTIFKPVLSSLNMEYSVFLDLCIMSGCDFNDNMPHLGIKKSYDILSECKSIDNLPQKYHTKSKCYRADHVTCCRIKDTYDDQTLCLDHETCRGIFSHSVSETFCQGDIVLDVNTDTTHSRDILEMYGCEDWIMDVMSLYRGMINPHNRIVPKRPSLSSSKVRLRVPTAGSSGLTLNIVNETPGNDRIVNDSVVIGGVTNGTVKLVVGKSSPKRITTKKRAALNKNQHARLLQRRNQAQND